MSTRDALRETGTIAILRGRPYEQAAPLVQALYAGGIRLAEVTVDSPDAFEMITKLRKIWDGKLYIGAGTITDEDGNCGRAVRRCPQLPSGGCVVVPEKQHSGFSRRVHAKRNTGRFGAGLRICQIVSSRPARAGIHS